MKRLVVLILLVLILLPLLGCGSTTMISGALLVDNLQSASGLVSIVHLTVTSGPNGTNIDITVVTLIASGSGRTLAFCGNQVGLFPTGTFVTATFQPGQDCSTISAVVKN